MLFSISKTRAAAIAAAVVLLLTPAAAWAGVVYIYGAETGLGAELSGCSSCVIESASPIRTGNYSLEQNTTATAEDAVTCGSTCTFRGYFQFDTAPSSDDDDLWEFRSGGAAVCGFSMDTDRTVDALAAGGTRQESATALSTGTWYRIEMQYIAGSGSNAVCTLRVDGTEEASSTDGTATGNPDMFRWGRITAGTYHVDDFLMRDDSTWPGAGQIEAIRPNDAGGEAASDWQNSAAAACTVGTADSDDSATNCSSEIDNVIASTADYIIRTNSGAGDILFDMTTIASVGTINAAHWVAYMEQASGGPSTTHAAKLEVNGTPESSGDLAPGTTPEVHTYDPTTEPTTQALLDNTRLGGAHDGAQDYQIFELWLMVDRTPAAGGGTSFAPFINFPLAF